MNKFSSVKQRKRKASSTNLVHVRHVQHRNLSSGTITRTTQKRYRSSESVAQSSNSVEEEEEETIGTSILSNETLASEKLKSQDSGTDVPRLPKGSTLKSSHDPSESSLTLSLPKEIRTSWLDNERSLDMDAIGQAQQLLSKPPAENRTTAKSIFSTNKSVILDPQRNSISGRLTDAPEQAMAGYFTVRPPDYPPEVFTETSEYDDVHQYQSVDGSFNSHSDREFRSVSSKFTAPGTQVSDVALAGGPATRIDSDVSVGTKPFAVLSQLDVAAVTEKPSVTGGTVSSWEPAAPVAGRATNVVPESSSVESNKYWSVDFLPSNFGTFVVTEGGFSESDLTATATNSCNKLDRPFAVSPALNSFDGQQIVRAPSSLNSIASSATSDQNTVASLQNIPGKMADLYQAFAASGREVDNATSTSSASFPVFRELTVIKSRTYVCTEETSRTISRELWPGVQQEPAVASSNVPAAIENAPTLIYADGSQEPEGYGHKEQTSATGQASTVSSLELEQGTLSRPETEFPTQKPSTQRPLKHYAVSSIHVGTKPLGGRDGKQPEKIAESGTLGPVPRCKSEAVARAPGPLYSSTAPGLDLDQRPQKQLPSSNGREDASATAAVRKKGEHHRKRHSPTASGGASPKALVEARTEHTVGRRSSAGAYSPKAGTPPQHAMGPPEWRSTVQPGLAPIEERLERSTTSFSITEAPAPTSKEPLPSNDDTYAVETRPVSPQISLVTDHSPAEVASSNDASEETSLAELTPSLPANSNSGKSLVPDLLENGIEQQTRDGTTDPDVVVELCVTNDPGRKPSTGSLTTVATVSVRHAADEQEKPTTGSEISEVSSHAAPLKARGSRESITCVSVTVSSSSNVPPNKRPSTESLKSLPGISAHENAEILQKPLTTRDIYEASALTSPAYKIEEDVVFRPPCVDVSSPTVSAGDSLEHLPVQKDQREDSKSLEETQNQAIVSLANELVPAPATDLGVPDSMVYGPPPTISPPGIFTDETSASFRWDHGVPQQGIIDDQAEQAAEREKSRYPDKTAAQEHPGDERPKPSPSSPVSRCVREPGFLYEEPLRRPTVSSSWAEASVQEEERRRSSSGAGAPRAPLTVPAALGEEHPTHLGLSHDQRRRSSAPSHTRASMAAAGIPPEEGAFSSSATSKRLTNTGEPTSRDRQGERSGSLTPDRSGVPGGKRSDFDHHGDVSRKSEEALGAATTQQVDRRSLATEGTLFEEPDQRAFSDLSERSASETNILVSASRGFQPVTSDMVSPQLNRSMTGVSEEPELTPREEDIRPDGLPPSSATKLLEEELSSSCGADGVTNLYQAGQSGYQGSSAWRMAWEPHEDLIDFEQSRGERSTTARDDGSSTTFMPLSWAELRNRLGRGTTGASGESLDERSEQTALYTTLGEYPLKARPPRGLASDRTSPLLEPPFADNAELPSEQSVTEVPQRDLIEWYEDQDDGVGGSTLSLEESQQPVEEIRLLAEAASRRRLQPPLVNMFPCEEERSRLYRPPVLLPPPLHLLSTARFTSTSAKPKKGASRHTARSRREAIDNMARVVALSFAFIAFVAAAGILLTGRTENARP